MNDIILKNKVQDLINEFEVKTLEDANTPVFKSRLFQIYEQWNWDFIAEHLMELDTEFRVAWRERFRAVEDEDRIHTPTLDGALAKLYVEGVFEKIMEDFDDGFYSSWFPYDYPEEEQMFNNVTYDLIAADRE